MRLLAAGIGVGALARFGARPAQAANGDPVLAGQTVDATAPTRIRNGVSYAADGTADGAQGYAAGANNAGLFGRNNDSGGVGVGGAAPSGTGVFGESSNGFGVGGRAASGVGVRGESTSGLGASFAGGLAALRIQPAASGTGAPTTGTHQVGELYADSTGMLFYCTAAGTPGTWQQVVVGSGGGLTNPMTAQDDLIIGGTAGAPARLAKGSNGQVLTLNGSGHVAWATPSGGGGGGPAWQRALVEPPDLGDFAWVNQGSATATKANSAIFMTVPANASTNLRVLKKAAPSTPYAITAAFVPLLFGATTNNFGLVYRQSSDGKLVFLTVGSSGGQGNHNMFASVSKYSAATTYNSNYSTWPIFPPAGLHWLRIEDTGTNRICSRSPDGHNWVVVSTHGRTDYLTANEVGFAVDASNGTYGPSALLVSWEVG